MSKTFITAVIDNLNKWEMRLKKDDVLHPEAGKKSQFNLRANILGDIATVLRKSLADMENKDWN